MHLNSICAFDIGIKNLSYCILECSKEENIKKIIKWELMDLRTSRKKCNVQLKSGETCQKNATMVHNTNTELFFCKKHAIQYRRQSTTEYYITEKEYQCEYENCKKYGSNKFGNEIYCDTHVKKIMRTFESNNKLRKMKVIGCMKEPLYDLGCHMYAELDKRPDILAVDKIVIENQPSMTNPTMKSISILLLSYFILRKHNCVEFIAPSGKLKINDSLTKNILSQCKKQSTKYKITKQLGIEYCLELLKSFEMGEFWGDKLNESKKKDDLSDSFLHAYYNMFGCGDLSSIEFVDNTTKLFSNKLKIIKDKKNRLIEDKKKVVKVDV